MKRTRLFGVGLRKAVQPLLAQLGEKDRERLARIVEIGSEPTIRLSDVLRIVAPPDKNEVEAQAALRMFRNRIKQIADEHGIAVMFRSDSKKKDRPETRECWFEGSDPAAVSAAQFSSDSIAQIKPTKVVPQQVIATSTSALVSGKRVVRFFLSYSHNEARLAEALTNLLRDQFGASRKYELDLWADRKILTGEPWHQEIQQAIKDCDFGLFLVSPAFLRSEYIKKHELPHFVDDRVCKPETKPVIPVGLVRVDFKEHDLKGLDEKQFFTPPAGSRFFDEMRGRPAQGGYAHQLFLKIVARLDCWFAGQEQELKRTIGAPPETIAETKARREIESAEAFAMRLPGTRGDKPFTPPKAIQTDLDKLERETPTLGTARDAISELEQWACDPGASPFYALLGEYGIGKTTTLKELTRRLLDLHEKDPASPLPIYIDLRIHTEIAKGRVPQLEELLTEIIQRNHKSTDTESLSAREVIRLVREEGAIILFDGLDEKIVHLNQNEGRAFIRELWKILPPALLKPDTNRRTGKLLISCRSHYFRDVADQNAMLVGEDREGMKRGAYPVSLLLPFNEEQIRQFLHDTFRINGEPEEALDAKVNGAFELIQTVHNLRDLAERPYLLSVITEHLAELERLRATGERVNAASLYEMMVRKWLNRDDGKHQIDPAHKRELMEALAGALWRESVKEWDADRLEEWLDQFLLDTPRVAGAYANKDRAVLKEDLRTATFVLRPDTEKKNFRFAHTSLQEFFLASYLARALRMGNVAAWNLPRVSTETYDFLGQLLQLQTEGDRCKSLVTLERILEKGGLAAEVAFAYWQHAIEKAFPEPAPKKVSLRGANLEEMHISGHGPNRLLSLRGADLTGAKLNRARLENVDLSETYLSETEARQAVFLNVQAEQARAARAEWDGLVWRHGSVEGLMGRSASIHGLEWIGVELQEATLPEDWEAVVEIAPTSEARVERSLALRTGHSDWVRSCGWSPDGQRLVSGSRDKTLRVWDAATGKCLLTLQGHSKSVISCGWSPDGQRLVSGSQDETLRVWEAATGKCLLTLDGHSNSVDSCGWSPDGQRLVSGSRDETLRVWDAATGKCLLTLDGHSNSVDSCGWSPDGQRLVSGSRDETLRVWDAATGKCLLTLDGHSDAVTSCGWSPDGQRLVSGSEDKTLLIWDAVTGKCLLTLVEGHSNGVTSCGWSPDGQRLVSGSDDKMLRVWEAATGKCLFSLKGHFAPVRSCSWSPDGRRLVSGSDDKMLRVWDAATGKCLLTLEGHSSLVYSCGWSPDGQRVVSGAIYGRRVWDVATGECLLVGEADSAVTSCGWSPDGQRLVSGSAGMVRVWDTTSNTCLLTLEGHEDYVWSCGWSPDGQRLVSGSSDNTLRMWDTALGTHLLTLDGHSNSVTSCGWSPDGQRLVSGSGDNTLRVWEAATGKCLLTLEGHSNGVTSCGWSPDGQRLVSGSHDSTLRVWDATSGQCLLVVMLLPNGETVTMDGEQTDVLSCSAGAWEYLGWRKYDAQQKRWRLLPAEAFGPLPVHEPPQGMNGRR